jgi:hypothetical protein
VRVFWGSLLLFFKLLQLFVLVAHFGVRDCDMEPYFEPDFAGGWPAAILDFPHFWLPFPLLQGNRQYRQFGFSPRPYFAQPRCCFCALVYGFWYIYSSFGYYF